MGKRSRWYAISATLILASVALLVIRGLNFGIDFTGGVVVEAAFPQAADLDKVRGALEQSGIRRCRRAEFRHLAGRADSPAAGGWQGRDTR